MKNLYYFVSETNMVICLEARNRFSAFRELNTHYPYHKWTFAKKASK